jgi:hypothetical protein
LEDNYEDIRVLPIASRIQLPRIDANRLSQRQPQAVAELARQPVWAVIPSRPQSVSETTFDSEYAALRATLLSLARDGHRLIGRIATDHLEADSRAVRGFLLRIDQFDELVTHHHIDPVRSWAHHLKCRVLDTAALHG